MKKVYLDQPTSSLGLFTLAALMDGDEECLVYFDGTDLAESVKKINPSAIAYHGNLDGMDSILIEGSANLNTTSFTLFITQAESSIEQALKHQGPHCILQVPCYYQQLGSLDGADSEDVEAVDAEDVALISATILSSSTTQQHSGNLYHLPGHRISAEFLAAIKHRLPVTTGKTTVIRTAFIEDNDWHKIIPGHEACTIEEYLQKCETSLYHQRFL